MIAPSPPTLSIPLVSNITGRLLDMACRFPGRALAPTEHDDSKI